VNQPITEQPQPTGCDGQLPAGTHIWSWKCLCGIVSGKGLGDKLSWEISGGDSQGLFGGDYMGKISEVVVGGISRKKRPGGVSGSPCRITKSHADRQTAFH